MLGWERRAAVRPSRRKRELTSEPSSSGLRILMATGRSRTSSLPRNTVDMPPEPISRTSANLPPRRLTTVLPGPSARLDDLPAHGAREGLEGLLEPEQSLYRQRLLPVAQRLPGIVVRLDHQAVRLRCHGGLGEGHDQVAPPGRVRGVHDYGQIREPLGDDDRREIEREARGGLEGADAPLAQHDVVPAGGGHVLRRKEPLLDRSREPALQHDAVVRAGYRRADVLEEGEVLHVARPDLENRGVLHDELYVVGVHDLRYDLEPERASDLGHDPEPLLTEALERVRGGARLKGAAAHVLEA